MKFTLSWLKDHLETDATLDEIVERLTMIGLEVEAVDDRSSYQPFTIAKVLSAAPHPDADKLQVLSVDIGAADPLQVVCGAPNARAGLVGAFAGPGTYVPGIDVTLGVGNIRGVESFGMMCSERELELSEEHDGIIDLPETVLADAPVGSSFADYAGLNDPVIEIGITPNRPDALGVSGIARDLAASGMGTVKTPAVPAIEGQGDCPVSVDLSTAGDFCPAFGLRLVRGVKNGPSPKWMQQRLKAIGLRPISALVDVTNYITFDRGRPLHVFDADKVKGRLVVRPATGEETMLGLDGKEYTPTAKHYVIADDNGPESLAGIMGGEESGCTETTVNVLVESALWDPLTVARTGRDLGIITDARYRFERGVDPQFMEAGLDLGTAMVMELCGGEPSKAVIAGEVPTPDLVIEFPLSETKRLTSIDVDGDTAKATLERLGFTVGGIGDTLTIGVPGTRPDVHGKADIVEELMRMHGVDNIEPQPLPALASVGERVLTTPQIRTRLAKRTLATRGMSEAVCYSFISKAQAELFGGGDDALELANPIASDMSHMRPSLLPSLLAAAGRNVARGVGDLAIFEVSHVYRGVEVADQHRAASGIRRGTAKLEATGRDWQGNTDAVGVFDAKADALAVIAACGMDPSKVQIEAGGPDWMHPGRSGTLKLGPKVVLGYFGEFHPMTLEAMDVTGPLCGFEIFMDAVPEPRRKGTRSKGALHLSPMQAVKRDFAFVLDRDVQATAVLRAAQGADKKLITDVKIFDLFEDASLGADKKSLAIEVTMQPAATSLTDEEIDAVAGKVVANVEKTTGGSLRG
ncbi:phenylalanine--tRNA ligase subunit beta [Ahrensia sp. R2A130]|uniref:phenylalanine--tRNA ligase subunit beta n=1 Tax=Ahrensia sp. R2A130 TaxID=744979 RepID=UPI0001E0C3A0|nr:phenylalanine--tRNA ligase subunit beta [Ahrensia sp. R2A130]EFL87851.1 phenylalanyl-tRNA synthetase, beta subunit [Ahrensia sp. R2A130]